MEPFLQFIGFSTFASTSFVQGCSTTPLFREMKNTEHRGGTVKHLKWSFFRKQYTVILPKSSIFDVRQGYEYSSALLTKNGTPEAVTLMCSVKKVFLKILQNSQENTTLSDSPCLKPATQVFPCEFCKTFQKRFFHLR